MLRNHNPRVGGSSTSSASISFSSKSANSYLSCVTSSWFNYEAQELVALTPAGALGCHVR